MNIPDLDIPESQKTPEWKKKIALSFATVALSDLKEKDVDITCWRFFNNEFLESDYEYLFKNREGGIDFVLPDRKSVV